MTTFRYKFSDEFLTKLDIFTRQHYMEESDLYKLSWESWKIYRNSFSCSSNFRANNDYDWE